MNKLDTMETKRSNLFSILLLSMMFYVVSTNSVDAQATLKQEKTVTYEEVFDLPYEVNPLYIHLQPMYADIYQTNVNFGFGVEAQYYLKNKFDFHIHGRKTYSRNFDIARDVAEKNTDNGNVPTSFEVYNFFEFGATYHINDREEESSTKVILYSKRYKDSKWASTIPKHITVPSKVRKYYGARLGGMFYNTTTDLSRAADRQNVVLMNGATPIASNNLFSNLSASAIYAGASMTWIKNFAIKPDRDFGILTNDLNFTAFLDIIVAPSVTLDDIQYFDGISTNPIVVSSAPINLSTVGFRAGLEGKFNRSFGFGYGAEIGVRPGVANRSFYTLVKISFPVFSAALKHEQEAFEK